MADGVGARLIKELSSTMIECGRCYGGRHEAPKSGGSCPCGMVTRILAPKRAPAGPPPEVLALLAQCLDGSEGLDAAASGLLRERADRLLAALTTAGLLLSAETAVGLAA